MENPNNAPEEQTPNNGTPETPQNEPKNDAQAAELAKAQAEIARLGKIINKYDAEKKQNAEEEAKKRGEFEKLFTEKTAELEALTATHDDLKSKAEVYEAHFKASYEAEVAKLSDEQKTLVEELLTGKSDFEKFSLLPKIIAQIAPQNAGFGGTPQGGNPPQNATSDELLKKGDVVGSLALKLQL